MGAGRSIELEVEVEGTPEEVWRSVATGPGISAWYVPHVVEEREGGAMRASFGDAPEMQVDGRVLVWDPPRRVVFDGGPDAEGFAFEWVVEPGDGGTCLVRLVNSGFGDGPEWDDEYDSMRGGWGLFLLNLQLHRRHFPGQEAVSMLPTGATTQPRVAAWSALCHGLHVPEAPAIGERIDAQTGDGLRLAGTVAATGPSSIALLLEEPAAGTAFLAVEGERGGPVSIWTYLYGPDAQALAERDAPRWAAWLEAFSAD